MLGPKIGLKSLKGFDQTSAEVAGGSDDWKIPARMPGRDFSLPPADLRKGGSGSGTCSRDETFSLDVQAAHENSGPLQLAHEIGLSSSCSSMHGTFDSPKAHKEGSSGTLQPPLAINVDPSIAPLAPQFPGFAETNFSTPKNRYFYAQNSRTFARSGCFGDVKEVHWYNPETGVLESCVSKTLKADMAVMQSDGCQASASREVTALKWVAGVAGAVRYRDLIPGPDGAIHIILEKVEGVRLPTRIDYRNVEVMGLTWREIRVALQHLAEVLADCHRRGLVHGDVKPENIMSLSDNSGIVLVDFGSASIQNGNGWEYVGGTLLYIAPEVFSSARKKFNGDASLCIPGYGPPADCWAYGLTAFKMLTGCPLFEVVGDASPSGSGMDGDRAAWSRRCITALHAEWADESESGPVHATFREKVQQLAEVSEEFQRDAIHFLRSLLQVDPANRLTAEKALQHAFLSNLYNSDALDSMPPDMDEEEFTYDTTLERQLRDEVLGLLEE